MNLKVLNDRRSLQVSALCRSVSFVLTFGAALLQLLGRKEDERRTRQV
jgi:hypothetical protein